jgi:Fic/DOC family
MISNRQQQIINTISCQSLGSSEVLSRLVDVGFDVSEDTLVRELKDLVESGLVVSRGSGPARLHALTALGLIQVQRTDGDINKYFNDDSRPPKEYVTEAADSLVRYLNSLRLDPEIELISQKYTKFMGSLDASTLTRWRQKWLIEFAWKSSSIEGNTYSELETETLLLDKVLATGKTEQEAYMITNHQKAYDVIRRDVGEYGELTKDQIISLHTALVENLDVTLGLRNSPVRISGSRYIPLSGSEVISSELDSIILSVNSVKEPFLKSVACLLLLSYLQTFSDGNKRTARLVANAVLEHAECPPLIFGGINPTDYRRACILFYELLDPRPMLRIAYSSYSKLAEDLV